MAERKSEKLNKRAREIEKAMRLVWSSLDSHLPWTYDKRAEGGKAFQKKCVKEYAEILLILSHLY